MVSDGELDGDYQRFMAKQAIYIEKMVIRLAGETKEVVENARSPEAVSAMHALVDPINTGLRDAKIKMVEVCTRYL